MPTVAELGAIRWPSADFARQLDRIVRYSGHTGIEFERVRMRALFLQELNGRYPQLASRLYQLPEILNEQFKMQPLKMTDHNVKAWVLDSWARTNQWPGRDCDHLQLAVRCWGWQFKLDSDWIQDAAMRSLSEMLRIGGPSCGLGLGWADLIALPGSNKLFRENEDGTPFDGVDVWDGEEPHTDWQAIPIHIQHLLTPERWLGDGVPTDSLIGYYAPRHGDTRAAAKKRVMHELRQRVDQLLARLESADLAEPGATRTLDRSPAHFDWLIRYQVLGQSQKAIAEAEQISQQAVSQAIANAAAACGLPLREPNPGGAPKGKKQNRVN